MGRFDSFLSNTLNNLDKVKDSISGLAKSTNESVSSKLKETREDLEQKREIRKKEKEDKQRGEQLKRDNIKKYDYYIKPLLEFIEKDRSLFKKYKDGNDTRLLCAFLLKENEAFITTLGSALDSQTLGTFTPTDDAKVVIPRRVFGFTESTENNRQIIKDGIEAINEAVKQLFEMDDEIIIEVIQTDNIVDKEYVEQKYLTAVLPMNSPIRPKKKLSLAEEVVGFATVFAIKATTEGVDFTINKIKETMQKNEGDHEYELRIHRKTRNVIF